MLPLLPPLPSPCVPLSDPGPLSRLLHPASLLANRSLGLHLIFDDILFSDGSVSHGPVKQNVAVCHNAAAAAIIESSFLDGPT